MKLLVESWLFLLDLQLYLLQTELYLGSIRLANVNLCFNDIGILLRFDKWHGLWFLNYLIVSFLVSYKSCTYHYIFCVYILRIIIYIFFYININKIKYKLRQQQTWTLVDKHLLESIGNHHRPYTSAKSKRSLMRYQHFRRSTLFF